MTSKQSPRANVLAVDDRPANLLALEAAQGYTAGGIDYFGKPFDPDILKMTIAWFVRPRVRGGA